MWRGQLAVLRVPESIVQSFTSYDVSILTSVALIVVMLLVIGCLLEPIAAILVVMPILHSTRRYTLTIHPTYW